MEAALQVAGPIRLRLCRFRKCTEGNFRIFDSHPVTLSTPRHMDTNTYTKIDGRATSNAIKEEIAAEVPTLIGGGKRPPCLVAVIVGDDGASRTYVNAKAKACEKVGFSGRV